MKKVYKAQCKFLSDSVQFYFNSLTRNFPKAGTVQCALGNFGCYTVEQYILIQTKGCKTIKFKEAITNKIEQIWSKEKVRLVFYFCFSNFVTSFVSL